MSSTHFVRNLQYSSVTSLALLIGVKIQYSIRCEGKKCPYETKTSSCPYEADSASSSKVFNVYAQEIDPRNRVPYNVNQLPLEDQEKVLSAERMKSSIPKSGGAYIIFSIFSLNFFFVNSYDNFCLS